MSHIQEVKPIELNSLVDKFLKDYDYAYKKEKFDFEFYSTKEDVRNLIEKIAVWYEMRYPDCEIKGNKIIDDLMFKNNKYINYLFEDMNNPIYLKWEDFFNFKTFFNTLSLEEKQFLYEPHYNNIVYIDKYRKNHFHLYDDGYIDEADLVNEKMIELYNNLFIEKNGKVHIKDMYFELNKKNLISDDSEVKRTIDNVSDFQFFREGILNSAMYRIIERGGDRIGPRRGLLFAKEFKRNLMTPMMYGYDTSDPNMDEFILDYVEAGGNQDINCYVNYFNRESKNNRVELIPFVLLYEKVKEKQKVKRIDE